MAKFTLSNLYDRCDAKTAVDMNKIAQIVDDADDAVSLCEEISDKYAYELTLKEANDLLSDRF